MIKNLKKHTLYYLSLLFIVFGGVFVAFKTGYDKNLQLFIVFMTCFLYSLWGILHHLISHDLTKKIVVEYVLVGGLGLVIVLFLLRLIS